MRREIRISWARRQLPRDDELPDLTASRSASHHEDQRLSKISKRTASARILFRKNKMTAKRSPRHFQHTTSQTVPHRPPNGGSHRMAEVRQRGGVRLLMTKTSQLRHQYRAMRNLRLQNWCMVGRVPTSSIISMDTSPPATQTITAPRMVLRAPLWSIPAGERLHEATR